jgi:hypothetical protein
MDIEDFVRRTVRTWALAQLVYAVVLLGLVIFYIPWKTPWVNVALLLYATSHGIGAFGLWRQRKWGWSLSLAAGLAGLLVAVVVCGGMVASWAYLRGIFGDFGHGASIGALIVTSVALQLLGLFPALQLRALLRREVRRLMGVGKAAVTAVALSCLIPLPVGLVVHQWYGLTPLPALPQAARVAATEHLQRALEGQPSSDLAALEAYPAGVGPLVVSLWHRGRIVLRVEGQGPTMADAVGQAGEALARQSSELSPDSRDEGQLKIDRLIAEGPVAAESGPILSLSVVPGLDGLQRCTDDGTCQRVLPDDLVHKGRFGAAPLVPGIRELRVGLDTAPVLNQLAESQGPLERFRTESWVAHDSEVLPSWRGNTPGPNPSPLVWHDAAVAAGDFILRRLQRNGRFRYSYDPVKPTARRQRGYSLARHAGAGYALSQLFQQTGAPRFARGAAQANAWLAGKIPQRCGAAPGSCVVRGGRSSMNATALAAVGLLQYQRATGDSSFEAKARALADFIEHMQRSDGGFYHIYDVRESAIDTTTRRMFASGQAALALLMAHEVLGHEKYLQAASRGLDYLTGRRHNYMLGRFIYGDDHWTCIAAGEAYPRVQSKQHLGFCRGYLSFLGRIQYRVPGPTTMDFVGHYGFGTLAVPYSTATATVTEAAISTLHLSQLHQQRDDKLAAQIALALNALVRDQIREDNSWTFVNPAEAIGGFRRSLVEQDVRIDFPQHAASALLRGAALLGSSPPTANGASAG